MNKIILITLVLFLTPFILAEISYPVSNLGNCASQEECKIYCDNNEHIKECIEFAEKNNLMSQEEIQEAKKMIDYILNGETPGKCTSKDECNEYCSKEENLEECIQFALKIGDITEEEAEMVRKTGGKGPGDCRGPTECDAYCNKDENIMKCIEFAYEHGMIDEEEYEIVKKTGGKGPGGCQGQEECDAYCKEHEEECFEFAKEYGLLNEEEIADRENMGEEEKCMIKCLEKKGIEFKECGPSKGGEAGNSDCKACADECMKFYEGPCLTEEEWGRKEEECQSQGEYMEARPIIGDSGQEGKGECAIDVECIDHSGEWGDEPGEGPGTGQEEYMPPEEFKEVYQEEQEPTPEPEETSTEEPTITAEVILTEETIKQYSNNVEFIFR